MEIALLIVGYIAVAFVTEFAAALTGRGMNGLGFIWPVSIPLGLLFIGLSWVENKGRDIHWKRR